MLERRRNTPDMVEFDEEGVRRGFAFSGRSAPDPAALLQQQDTRKHVDAALRALSPVLREVIVLREFEDLEYAEIAKIVAVPIGHRDVAPVAARAKKLRGVLSQSNLGH